VAVTIAFIDGDPLLYVVSWGHVDPIFGYRTQPSFQSAADHLVRLIDDTVKSVFADDYMIAAGNSQGNWRSDFYSDYKRSNSREKSRQSKPDWWPDLVKVLYDQPHCVRCDGFEADDLIGIWASECVDKDYIIVSPDKDLNNIPGLHYSPKSGIAIDVSEEYATKFFWTQMLTGDSTDNIPGIPRVGPVKAAAILDGAVGEAEFRDRVIDAYIDKFGEDWHSQFLSNFRMLHIWRKPFDFTSIFDSRIV
jgi:5'-3' exonuclease, N-terminal resolvase-like domain